MASDVEQLEARIAELEQQLAESRDFAISEAAKIRAAYEHQQAVLVDALSKIEKWFGEFPPTGKIWPDGEPVSYATEYGSNGERDFMRGVAREALAQMQKPVLIFKNGLICSVCNSPQYYSPSGVTCINGHDGVEGKKGSE